MAAPAPNVSRAETSMYLSWGRENPALFVQSVERFQQDHPVTHWRHHIDLGLRGSVKLIAVRREQPFDSVQDYLAVDNLYLSEIGMGR